MADRPWQQELLYGPDGWYMLCYLCGARLEEGEYAWTRDDDLGNADAAQCLDHGDPNPVTPEIIAEAMAGLEAILQ